LSDDDYEPGGGPAPAAPAASADASLPGGPQRIVVEAILGWRWPLAAAAQQAVPLPVAVPLPADVIQAVQAASQPILIPPQLPGDAATATAPAASPAEPAAGPLQAAVDAAVPMTVDAPVEPKQEPSDQPAAADAGAGQGGGAAADPALAATAAVQAAAGAVPPLPAAGPAEAAPPAPSSEMDAVAALLSATEAAAPPGAPPLPLPLPSPEDGAAAAAAALAAAASAAPEPEYLVKYVGRSHAHNEWVPESTLLQIAKRKVRGGAARGAQLAAASCSACRAAHPAALHAAGRPQLTLSPSHTLCPLYRQVLNFKKRYSSAPCSHMDERWARPERFVARRASPHGPGWEVLVKWCGLGYEHATWEVSVKGVPWGWGLGACGGGGSTLAEQAPTDPPRFPSPPQPPPLPACSAACPNLLPSLSPPPPHPPSERV
jgi:virulence-associated protein VagC